MKRLFFIFLLTSSLSIGQKTDIEKLINQVIEQEIPKEFRFFYLFPKSIEEPKVTDSLQNYQIREFKNKDKNFPVNLYYEQQKEKIDWNEYQLKNAKYLEIKKPYWTHPPTSKNVLFVKFNIRQKEYDRLTKNRVINTIVVRKKWHWRKSRIWTNPKFKRELEKAWELNKKVNPEEEVYFEISKPLFSKNGQYAKISIFEKTPCKGFGQTNIYKKENGKWTKVYWSDFPYRTEIAQTHSRCGNIAVSIYE